MISGSADVARQILTSIAAAVITVVGVIFSIILVTLTMASTQFGPRMLRNFIRDRGTQLTLGTFVATFVYAVLVLVSIGPDPHGDFVPHIGVTTTLGLMVADLAILIYFRGEAPPGAPAPTPADLPLPEVSAGGLSGLLEILAARGGQDGLAELADDLSFEIDDLLPLVDAAVLLGLAHVHEAQLEITEAGRDFAAADIDTSKTLFGELAAARAPLIKAILRALHATSDGSLREGFFLDLLRRGFSADEARRQLGIAIDWGRYGELFEYDAERGELILEPAEPAGPARAS
jgi:hypothetical protein